MVSNNLKNKAETKNREQKNNEISVNRLMIAFILGAVAVCGMLLAKKTISNEAFFITNILPVLIVISSVGLIAAIVNFAIAKNRHVDDSAKIFTKWNILGAAVVFFGTVGFYRLSFDAATCIIALIAAVVLYFVFRLFKSDFFIFSAITAAGLMLLKIGNTKYYSTLGNIMTTACFALAAIIAVAGIVFAVVMIKRKGIVQLGGLKVTLFDKNGNIYPIFVAAALLLAGGITGIIASAAVIYIIAALLVAYLVIAVAYVIKMM